MCVQMEGFRRVDGGKGFLNGVPITGKERDNLSEEERCHLHCEHTLITPALPPSLQHSITALPLLRHLTHSITQLPSPPLSHPPQPSFFFNPLVCVRQGPALTNRKAHTHRSPSHGKHLSHSDTIVSLCFLSGARV